jgi:MFS family permease
MKPLRWYDFITINLFWLGLNIRNNAVNGIFMPYLAIAFAPEALRNTAFGEMRTAGLVIAMLVQPAMGILSDRSTSRFGRRRPFIFVGVLIDLVFLVLIAFAWDYWSLLVAVLLTQFSGNTSHGALQGLIPDLVPENQRGTASGVKGVMELLPLILLSVTVANIVGGGHFRLGVLVTGVAVLVIMLLTMFLVKEEPLSVRPQVALGPTMLRVLGMLAGIASGAAAGILTGGAIGGLLWLIFKPFAGEATARTLGFGFGGLVAMTVAVIAGVWAGTGATLGWKNAREHSTFGWWVVNRLLFFTAVTSIQSFAPFFLMYAFSIDRDAATKMTGQLMVAVGLCTLAAALPGGWLSDRFGHRRLVGLSGILGAVGTALLLGTIWAPRLWLIYVAGIILGLGVGLFTATNWALGTSLVPPQEAGRYLGISNLAGAGAGMVGTGLGGPIADALNAVSPGLGYFALFACYTVLLAFSVIGLRGVKAAV